MRVLLAGGGTGGHIYPLLAVAQAAPDWRCSYVGTATGLEARIVPRTGIPFHTVAAGGVRGKSPTQRLRGLWRTAHGSLGAWRLLGRLRPDVVVSSGGYAAFPVALAARWRRIPLVLIEPNATPGLANRILMGRADCILVGYAAAREKLPAALQHRTAVTGVPVRTFGARERLAARKAIGIEQDSVLVAVTGGSQGARALTSAVCSIGERIGKGEEVLLATGQREYERWSARAEGRLHIVPYFWNMDDVLAAADVFIGRAGAMTCAELTVMGLPSVLVPLPNAAVHQIDNARLLVDAGAAVLLEEDRLTPETLWQTLEPLLRDPVLRAQMADASRAIGQPDAAAAVVREVRHVVAGRSVTA
ncbi:MAG: undecaprenyldiphospho-muramoylpentapeptide beta-N-acetylglucosaminyltransferase [Thermaerobacter sp.]|nr:undecaprenyldiphospho-muramoylpentapeptide beta-N-acetylglucosaminyltransferase [Thermaerobacter sp.]